eukprot:g19697.t1
MLRRRLSSFVLVKNLPRRASLASLVFFSVVPPRRAVIQEGDTNARWYADFSLQLNLTEIVNDHFNTSGRAAGAAYSLDDYGPGDLPAVMHPEVLAHHGDRLEIHAAVFQEDVRQYYESGRVSGSSEALPLALFLASAPYVLQQQLLQECPMMMAASFLLAAEVLAQVGADAKTALHKYEVARHIARENPDHTDAWGFSHGARRFEELFQREKTASVVDVVVVHCRESLQWLRNMFSREKMFLVRKGAENRLTFVTKLRIFVYHKCGSLPPTEEESLLSDYGLDVLSDRVSDDDIKAIYPRARSLDNKTDVKHTRLYRKSTFRTQRQHTTTDAEHSTTRSTSAAAEDEGSLFGAPVEFFFTELRNYAMESVGYATHLAHFDDHGSDVLFFLQGDPLHHQVPHMLAVAIKMVTAGTFAGSGIRFLHLNQRRFLGSSHECVYELLAKMGFPEVQTFAGYCCSQFVVARSAVLPPAGGGGQGEHHETQSTTTPGGKTNIDGVGEVEVEAAFAYRQARKLLNQEIKIKCSQDTSHDARPGIHTSALYEHMWHVLFQRPGVLPMRKNDLDLPVFFRTEGTDPVWRNFALAAVAKETMAGSMFETSS